MRATLLDMRRNPGKILEAIARNETVTLTRRGKPLARLEPVRKDPRPRASDHEAFGMWADRPEMTDPTAFVQEMRKGRIHAF